MLPYFFDMENFFLEMGLSWTLSKVLPFVVMLVLGVILFYFSRKFFTKKWLRYASILFIIIPASIYFSLAPIYEGDFMNSYVTEKVGENYLELKEGHLSVITIPNCPYCSESISKLKRMQSRTSSGEIDFIVCTSDSLNLGMYQEISDDKLNIVLADNIDEMSKLAEGRFPTFVYLNSKGELRKWSNENFGVGALDWVEAKLNDAKYD